MGLPDSSETNFNVFPGVLKTCQFISWNILTGVNTVQRNSCYASFFKSMPYLHFEFDLYSKQFNFDLLLHFVVILEFCFLSESKYRLRDWLIAWLIPSFPLRDGFAKALTSGYFFSQFLSVKVKLLTIGN